MERPKKRGGEEGRRGTGFAREQFGGGVTLARVVAVLRAGPPARSPAGRPAAITQDLGRFWDSGYGEGRRELRGRYPKHPWPEDPRQGIATALTKAALARAAGQG